MHLLRGERRWVDLGVECQGERLAMTGCRRLGGGLDSWCGDEPYCVLRGTGEGCVCVWSGVWIGFFFIFKISFRFLVFSDLGLGLDLGNYKKNLTIQN